MRTPAAFLLILSVSTAFASETSLEPPRDGRCRLVPRWRATPPSEKALAWLHAKDDTYPEERAHEEIRPRLDALRETLLRGKTDLRALLAPQFLGGRLSPPGERVIKKTASLELHRSEGPGETPALDARAFPRELEGWLADFGPRHAVDLDAVEITLPAADTAEMLVDFDVAGTARGGGRAQKIGRWKLGWQKSGDGTWRLSRWQALQQTRSRATASLFTEATDAALAPSAAAREQLRHGADHWRRTMDYVLAPDVSSHSGVAAGDVDGDGLDDLYVSQPSGLPNRLLRNRGDGTFADITEAAGVGLLDASPMSLFADVENDGDQDLVVLTWTQPLLFINDGQARFTTRKSAFRFQEAPQGTLIAMAMADYDRDGFLDLYLATYNYFVGKSEASLPSPYHDAQNGPPNVLFRNDGRGGFEDVTRGSGVDIRNNRMSLAPAWADYDGDGWIDLVVANDFGRKTLYRNLGLVDGRVRFDEVSASAGVEDIGAGMSSAWLDYDNDGRLDLYVANMWMAAGLRLTALPSFQPAAPADVRAQIRHHAQGNSLFRNRGDGRFEDVTTASRTFKGRWGWASDALDFDNDGWEDLYLTNGMITNPDPDPALGDLDSFYWRRVIGQSPVTRRPAPGFEDAWTALIKLLRGRGAQAAHERNVFLHNNGDGTFDNLEGALGLDVDQDARALAISDYDADGDLDVFVKARNGPQLRYFRNDGDGGHGVLAVRLTGATSNRDAVGAVVRVQSERGTQTKVIQCGNGYLSQRSKELLFGLGDAREIRRVEVTWPDGRKQELTGVAPNQRVRVVEGQADVEIAALARTTPVPTAGTAAETQAIASATPAPTGTWLYERYPAPDFTLADAAGAERTLASLAGKPVVLHFTSAACAPCVPVRQTLERGRAEIEASGAVWWPIAVSGAGTPSGVDEVVAIYSAVHRFLFEYAEDLSVPTTLLIDARGEIAKVYRGAVAPESIAADVREIDVPADRHLARGLPFDGRFHSPIKARPDFQIGMELTGRGYETPALIAFQRAARNAPDAFTHYNLGTLYMKRGERARAELSLQKALAVQPNYPEAQNSLGVILAERGEVEQAVSYFQAALTARPDFADAMNNLGYTLLQADRVEPALELFQKALSAQPDFPEVYNNLGIYYGQEGDLERAEAHFKKAIEQRPAYGEAVNNLAMVYGATGRGAQAVTLLEQSLARDPEFEMTYVVLARLLAESGRRDDAVRTLERLLQRNPRHPAALKLLPQLR